MFFTALVAVAVATPVQAQDTAYTRLIQEATTDTRFLPPSVATLPTSPTVPSPLDHFGSIVGAAGIMHSTAEIYGYYRALAAASPRVRLETIGTSEGGREILLAIIADEATLSQLDSVKADLTALADPRRTDRGAMERIAARAKPVYYIQAGLHSPEMGPPEMVLELAYRLAVSEDPAVARIRNNVVTLINPAAEPDGRDRQVDWYRRYTKGRPEINDGFPRSSPFWGKYVYHDNNRDGLQISQALTKAVVDLYYDWHPTIMHDLHESVPLLYISTGTGPYNRTVDPITITEWQTLANWDVQALTAQGAPGAWTWGFYDGWWPGYAIWVAINHNGIGRFYETFGNSGADTYLRDLSGATYARDSVTTPQWYRPWPPTRKVLWSLRNNTNYMQAGVLASLDYAARHHEDLLRHFWQKGANSIHRGRSEPPYAYLIPPLDTQRDPRRAAYLVNQLRRHGIEVHRATDTLAGSYIVRLDQPYSDLARNLLSKQDYPASAQYPPYDDIAWTFGLLYGVTVETVDDRSVFDWPGLQPATDTVAYLPQVNASGSRRSTWLLRYRGQAETLPALYALAVRDSQVVASAAEQEFSSADTTWEAGTVILEQLRGADADWLATTFGLALVRGNANDVTRHALDTPRIAVYHPWFSTQAEGWVRYWFDQIKLPYTSIDKDDLRRGDLRSRFDVILVPDGGGSAATWTHGVDSKWGPLPYTATTEFPSHGTPLASPDITGGPGFDGLANLERFLDGGGTVITLGNAGRMVAETGIARELSPYSATGLFHPGSIVRAKIRRTSSPIMYGYPDTLHLFRGNLPLWQTARRNRQSIVLQYGTGTLADERDTVVTDIMGMPDTQAGDSAPASEPATKRSPGGPYVLSGMVRNSNRIDGQGAIFDLPAGRDDAGRVIVFTFNPLHRFLNHHDAPMVFNAMMHWNDH